MNFNQYPQIQYIRKFDFENEVSFIQSEDTSDGCGLNEESLILPKIIEERKNTAEAYQDEKNSGKFEYLQTQLCGTIPSEYENRKSFVHHLNTPFGKVYLLFRYFSRSNRYTRFVLGGGKYTSLVERLDSKYTSKVKREDIYSTILDYLTSEPSSDDAWTSSCSVQGTDDKDLAYFCAIVSVCDPCYGKGENGGKDIRTVLRSKECQNGCKFKKFLNPLFYPLSQRRAYAICREYQDKKVKRSLPGTKRTINRTTKLFSASKPKATSRLIKSHIPSQKKINFEEE